MKELLKSVIALVIAFAYSAIIAKFPDFPLAKDQLVSLILWLIGFAIGGWQANKYYVKKLYNKSLSDFYKYTVGKSNE